MEVDNALRKIGVGWRWQLKNAICITMFYIPYTLQSLNIVFLGWHPSFHCTSYSHLDHPNSTIKHIHDGRQEIKCSAQDHLNKTVLCNSWQYQADVRSTIVSEWDLVCKREYYVDLSQTLFYSGLWLATLIVPTIMDKFGRKTLLVSASFMLLTTSVTTAFAPNIWFFFVCRFLTGVCCQSTSLPINTLTHENFPPRQRIGMYSWNMITVALSTTILSAVGYFDLQWRYLQIFCCIPSALSVIAIYSLDESIHWIVDKGKTERAIGLLQKAARLNGVTLSDTSYNDVRRLCDQKRPDFEPIPSSSSTTPNTRRRCCCCCSNNDAPRSKETSTATVKISDLFHHPVLRLNVPLFMVIFFTTYMMYYGTFFSSPVMAGERHRNILLQGLAQLPAALIAVPVQKWFGGRRTLLLFGLTSGICMGISTVVPLLLDGQEMVTVLTALNMVTKFVITVNTIVIRWFSNGVFPTYARAKAAGLTVTSSRIAMILVPNLHFLIIHHPKMMGVSFCALSLIACLSVIPLKEPYTHTTETISS